MIKTIIYENYNLLGNGRLAYISTADAQHVIGCLILNTKPFILPMNSFGCIYSQIHKRSLLSVLFCVRRWISLSQNLRTRKSPNPFLQSSQVWLKSTMLHSLFWITVHPPPAVVWSQYTSKELCYQGRLYKRR